jgi:hypothetical protein
LDNGSVRFAATLGGKAMRVKYEVYRDGDWLVAAAIVKFNRKEERRLAELIEAEGEITLCFLTTLDRVENPLIIKQELDATELDSADEERLMHSDLLGMVEEEVADLRDLLELGEPTTKQKGVNDYERLHRELALAC